ncbi:MAG: recombinase family protein [Pseudonocardiales bacterium]
MRTRPTSRHPAQQVSISKLARMLRDRYYLGYITYRGEELSGRHQPLIDQHLFDRVQAVLDARTTSGERRRCTTTTSKAADGFTGPFPSR